ncbi:MAG: hypothetical protein ACRYF2_12655 [Janthinobacterium lividum]
MRSHLLLPPDAPEARIARDEAAGMRRQLLKRAVMRQAATWLDHCIQLGRNVFGRGNAIETARPGRITDITARFRPCLVGFTVREQVDADQLRSSSSGGWRTPRGV